LHYGRKSKGDQHERDEKYCFHYVRVLQKLLELVNPKSRGPNRRFKLEKRGQLFIRSHNGALTIVAVCVGNKDRSPVGIHG
jgi:hypothetical protein